MSQVFHIDLAVIQDFPSASILTEMLTAGEKPACRTIIVIDQVVPPNSPEVSALHRELIGAATEYDIPLHYGRGMSAHIAAGFVKRGEVVVSSDPEILGVGGVGALGLRVTDDELREVLTSGSLELEEREEIHVLLEDACPTAQTKLKQTALGLIKDLGTGARGKDVRVSGIDPGDFEHDELIAFAALVGRSGARSVVLERAGAAVPDLTFDCAEDAAALVVLPGSYDELLPACELPLTQVNAVYIGGTSGGTLRELRAAAAILRGRKLAFGTRLTLSPATADIYVEAANLGLFTEFMEAGCLVLNQCARPDVQGRIGRNEVMVSNDLENAVGYAGFDTSKIYITDTETAVRAALAGHLGSAETLSDEDTDERGSLVFEGRCWKFGDDIDTDIIIPTQHLNYETMEEIRQHAFEPLRPELPSLMKEGDIIVAGSNFGCGSSREQAAEVIVANGVHCVIAKSFARIFFRNAINNGVLLLECPDLPDNVSEGDTVRVELGRQLVMANAQSYSIPAVPENLYRIIMDGGLVKNIEKKMKKMSEKEAK